MDSGVDGNTKRVSSARQELQAKSAKVDWSSFPLFPLKQIELLELEELQRTEEELCRLQSSLKDSQDAGDAALLGYIRKELQVIEERTQVLVACKRVQEMLEGNFVPRMSELSFDQQYQQRSSWYRTSEPNTKPSREKKASYVSEERPETCKHEKIEPTETIPQNNQHDHASNEDTEKEDCEKEVRNQEPTPSSNESEEKKYMERRRMISFRRETGRNVVDSTWGKTFVVYADAPKRARRKQQERERLRMIENAKKRAQKKKDQERKKKQEQRRLAREKLREREAAREKWEKERQERIERAKILAKQMSQQRSQMNSARSGVSNSEECPKVSNSTDGMFHEDEEYDEEQVRLEEALEEEEAANEDDQTRNQTKQMLEAKDDESDQDESEVESEKEDTDEIDTMQQQSSTPKQQQQQQQQQQHTKRAEIKEDEGKEEDQIADVENEDDEDEDEDSVFGNELLCPAIPRDEATVEMKESGSKQILSDEVTAEMQESCSHPSDGAIVEMEERRLDQIPSDEAAVEANSSQQVPSGSATVEIERSNRDVEEKGECEIELAKEEKVFEAEEEKEDEENKVYEEHEEKENGEGKEDKEKAGDDGQTLLERLKGDISCIQRDLEMDLSSFAQDLDQVENELENGGGVDESNEDRTQEISIKPDADTESDMSDSESVSEDEEDEAQTDLNAPGAISFALKRVSLKGGYMDYKDYIQNFGEIFTIWHGLDSRKANKAKILEKCIADAIFHLRASNPVLGMHMVDGTPESSQTNALTAWRENAGERFYRVLSRSRHEVYNIVKEACENLHTLGLEHESLVGKLKEKSDPSAICSTKRPMHQLPNEVGSIWNLLWTWSKPKVNRESLFTWQRVNHFHMARTLTRKDLLKQELQKYRSMSQYLANEFELLPETFILPKEYIQFVDAFAKFGELYPDRNYWIMKPVGLSRGRGISLVSDIGDVCYGQSVIIQRYLANPLLLDGYKFDLRIYVLVTSFSPLEAWIYDEGFVRVCTHKYSAESFDLKNLFIHLTNSSIQKLGPNGSGTKATAESIARHKADIDEAGGTKLSLTYLWRRLTALGYDVESIKRSIELLILKSLVCCDENMTHQPNSFELFGYDVLIDEDLRPWLIEINSSPSMAQENQLDSKIKRRLVADTIRLVDPVPFDRAALLEVLQKRASDMEQNRLRPFQQNDDKETERQRLDREMTAILHGRKPRKFGELPAYPGLYRRLCPEEKVYDTVKKIIRQDRTKQRQASAAVAVGKRPAKPKRRQFVPPVAGKGSLQYLAEGCNIAL